MPPGQPRMIDQFRRRSDGEGRIKAPGVRISASRRTGGRRAVAFQRLLKQNGRSLSSVGTFSFAGLDRNGHARALDHGMLLYQEPDRGATNSSDLLKAPRARTISRLRGLPRGKSPRENFYRCIVRAEML